MTIFPDRAPVQSVTGHWTMSFFIRSAILLALLCAPTGGADAQLRSGWITAYYPWWYYNVMPPAEIDFASLTHIVVFSANPKKTAPYLDVLINPHDSANVVNGLDCGQPGDYLHQLTTLAHARGVKVLLSVGGIWGIGAENMRFIAADDQRIAVFAAASCAFAQRHGMDGIELDWEFPKPADKYRHSLLIAKFREILNSWKQRGTFAAATADAPLSAYDKEAMVAAFDQINPMSYELYVGDYSKNLTGYTAPLRQSSQFTPYIGAAVDQPGHGPKAWLAQGYPAAKIGLSISFTTTVFTNVAAPTQPARPYGGHAWGNIRDVPKSGRHWDATSLVPWQASGSTFITYEDTASCRLKVEYAASLGLGGVMLYELGAGYEPNEQRGKRDLLLKAASAAMRPSGKAQPGARKR